MFILFAICCFCFFWNSRFKDRHGIFPKSYIHLCDYKIVNNEYCIQRTDIVEEITKVLLEWGNILKQYFLVGSINLKRFS